MKKKKGIAKKLVAAIMATIVLMVAAMLFIVYNRVSDTLQEKARNCWRKRWIRRCRRPGHG